MYTYLAGAFQLTNRAEGDESALGAKTPSGAEDKGRSICSYGYEHINKDFKKQENVLGKLGD